MELVALDLLPPVLPIVEQPPSPVAPAIPQGMAKQLEQRQEVAELRELRREQQHSPDLVDYDIFANDGDELFDDSNDPFDEDQQEAEVVVRALEQDAEVLVHAPEQEQ